MDISRDKMDLFNETAVKIFITSSRIRVNDLRVDPIIKIIKTLNIDNHKQIILTEY